MAPSSFASAAAGSNQNPSRNDGGSEWSRRPNGATQTFRRPSHATSLSGSSHQRDGSNSQGPAPAMSSGVYVPPHLQATRNGSLAETRYPKDQLLQLFRNQRDNADLSERLEALYVGGWEPSIPNGVAAAGWGRREDLSRDPQSGADICWEVDASVEPLGLDGLTEEERQVFSTSVNSAAKPPNQAVNKDASVKEGTTGRKTSISQQNGSSSYGLASPTGTRPNTRRRELSDAYPFPSTATASPTASSTRYGREESNTATPPPALLRRRTDFKDPALTPTTEERERESERDKAREGGQETSTPFGNLKRTSTAPFSAGLNGPASPWSGTPQSGGFSPMGTFGNFAIGAGSGSGQTPTDKKMGFGSMRGESRFKGLMSKDMSDDAKSLRERGSLNSLDKVNETDSGRATPAWMEARAQRPMSNETDPFPNDDFRAGSSALGGDDSSPPYQSGAPGFGTPVRQESQDEAALSSLGMTSDNLRGMFHSREDYSQQTPQHGRGGPHEPMSPTNTNPYQSPEHDRAELEDEDDGSDIHGAHLPGLGGFSAEQNPSAGLQQLGNLGGFGRGPSNLEAATSDRSQTSSAGPGRGLPGLGGLGGLPGLGGTSNVWGNAGTIGTPVRDRPGYPTGFGDGSFGSGADMQSPTLAGLGGSGIFSGGLGSGLGGAGAFGKGSKMGSLFPQAMQEQMRSGEPGRPANDESGMESTDRSTGAFGALGKPGFGGPGGLGRDIDSPFRSNRGLFDDALGEHTALSAKGDGSFPEQTTFGQMSSASLQTPLSASAGQGPIGQSRGQPQRAPGAPPTTGSSASSQPPTAQQRTMVMPDRMRWIYQDPQGNTQGPWSGLEMHDWYKAGFFSPELLVKKFEDPEYEPLAQLIRRIGNSREPFLVPQIGIPHGPATSQPGNAWAGASVASPSGAQPPFANSFPSFGTTLTAEQQNALERRKQEEQYLMARQKEHLAQQQAMLKNMQVPGSHGMHPQQLHHHSSAHSLHSQPSFGSITSPGGYQPSPGQVGSAAPQAAPGFFDNSFRAGPTGNLGPIGGGQDPLAHIREEDVPGIMDRLGFAGGQFGQRQGMSDPNDQVHAQQIHAMLNDRLRLQQEQAEHDQMGEVNEQQNAQHFADRLQQFQNLQIDTSLQHAGQQQSGGVIGRPVGASEEQTPQQRQYYEHEKFTGQDEHADQQEYESSPPSRQPETLSLTEQVQKAASAQQSPQQMSPWGKVETGMPMPFPPPQSSSPLPAPAARRNQNVADTLAAESRSRSETPSVDTPSTSIAPWAKEPSEALKGPSLKEIQAAEAKKAAQQEQLAAAARRAAMQKEILAQVDVPELAPGLPSSSTWASTASPVNTPGVSAWTKPTTVKTTAPAAGQAKKTLQQIQKEEEARKQRVAVAAAASAVATPGGTVPLSSGKRYADLASKTNPSPLSPAVGGAWTTVGASGKVKTPTTPSAPGLAAVRSTSSTALPTTATAKPKVAPTRSTTMGGPLSSGKIDALEEVKKWAVSELRSELSKGINVEDFVLSLLNLGYETDILTEAVHGSSQTLDSRHFAEEFVRRRRLADKGFVDTSAPPMPSSNGGADKSAGGWSEVAKKGPQTASPAAKEAPEFRVVGKKKGGKR